MNCSLVAIFSIKSGQRISGTDIGDQQLSTTVSEAGGWKVRLSPMVASSQGQTMTIATPGQSVKFEGVLIGDVWFASGQSNMQWSVKHSKDSQDEMADANYPMIRLYQVAHEVSRIPREDVHGTWTLCTPETIPDFSAVAYFFGREIHQRENVPIGLVHSSWGGTPSEAWTSLEMLEGHPDFSDRIADIRSSQDDFQAMHEQKQQYISEIRKVIRDVEAADDRTYANLSYDDDGWDEMTVPIHFHNTEIAGFQGMAWMRKHFTLTRKQSQEDLELVLGRIEQGDKTFVNGEFVGETYQTHEERRYRVPQGILREGDNVIAIRVKHMRNAGGGIYEGPLKALQDGKELLGLDGVWKYNHTLEHNFPFDATVYPHLPGTLFNAMVAPVIPFGIRGALWYQGESNASRAHQYREIFPAMIHDWRTRWGQGHFPFFFVQLANFLETKPEPSTDPWPELREAQREALRLPNTGMAVAIDIGEADDIHPRNKQDVGKRLALAALKVSYGRDIVYSGPSLSGVAIEGRKIRLTFEHVGQGLVVQGGGELKGFAISGSDEQFVWAKAEITGTNEVTVWSDEVGDPAAVRYAFANNPICNLYNDEGLPASPFKTDDFSWLTYGAK